MFTVYSDSRSDSTVVSNLFIDEYMKSANDAQIKVYLYLLRMTGAHRTTSISDMADLFNHTEKDVVRSLRYWEQRGLLDLTFSGENNLVSIRLCRPGAIRETSGPAMRILPFSSQTGTCQARPQQLASGGSILPAHCFPSCTAEKGIDPADSIEHHKTAGSDTYNPAGSHAHTAAAGSSTHSPAGSDTPDHTAGIRENSSSSPESLPSPCRKQISSDREISAREKPPADLIALENFRQNAGRAQLLFVIEQYIGKPLSLNEIRIIHHISEDLHFSDDLIDYLLQYCVDRGRKDFRYIEGVAENWAKEGILTPAQAESAAAAKDAAPADSSAAAEEKMPGRAGTVRQTRDRKKGEYPPRAQHGRSAGYSRTANSFNQFEQNSYDFDALEDELLGVSSSGLCGNSVPEDKKEKQEHTCH